MKIYSYKTKCSSCGTVSGIYSTDANFKKNTRCMNCGYKKAKPITKGELMKEKSLAEIHASKRGK
jgi:PHP family Zn ribbon phosphoesterase